ncbi:hypothetical protein L6452_09120 [Arctium lappa]|uniref:Uncharacterized protein n=1 Tax=Arctium lappa TaxID=4217 RepID=A0ACB9DKA4_ARCLA|nr:hypothetical protein L6452_09120 [Arctium lappa]
MIELKATTENIENLTNTTTQNSVDIQKIVSASVDNVTKAKFNQLAEVVKYNTEALKCLAEIVSKQHAPAHLASTSPSTKELLAALRTEIKDMGIVADVNVADYPHVCSIGQKVVRSEQLCLVTLSWHSRLVIVARVKGCSADLSYQNPKICYTFSLFDFQTLFENMVTTKMVNTRSHLQALPEGQVVTESTADRPNATVMMEPPVLPMLVGRVEQIPRTDIATADPIITKVIPQTQMMDMMRAMNETMVKQQELLIKLLEDREDW